MFQKVLITGFGGQLSFYMVKYLLENTNHEIIACARNPLSLPPEFQELTKNPRVKVTQLNLKNDFQIIDLIKKEAPDYFINLGGCSFVPDSWANPNETLDVNLKALVYILDAVATFVPNCRVFSAGSIEELNLNNVYALSKKAAGDLCKIYREKYNLSITHCQLGNSESPLRNENFITRKITKGVARIARAIKNKENFAPIYCGNINNKISWLHCKDTVDGIWRTLNQERHNAELWRPIGDTREFPLIRNKSLIPTSVKDYIICSDEVRTVKNFIELAFGEANIHGYWDGEDEGEKFIIENNVNDISELKNQVLVEIDLKFYRPDNKEVNYNSLKIREELGFSPKFQLEDVIKEMVAADLKS